MNLNRLNIQSYADRYDMVKVLANSGYKVWIETEKPADYSDTTYYVCFEVPSLN